MRSQNNRVRTRAAAVLCLLALVCYFGRAEASSGQLEVVASLQPWASLTSYVAGEYATVYTLLPAGASPHAFDPLPSQAVRLASADLVVMNGGLDDWLLRLLDATAASARRVTILEAVDFAAIEGDDHDHEADEHQDHEDEHVDEAGADTADESEKVNPHIWLDPTMAADGAAAIAVALAELAPEHRDYFEANAAALRLALFELDVELHDTLAPVAGASIVPFHDAWVYFARRYELDIVATLEPFPGREPSAAYLAQTVGQIRATGVKVIFTERQLSDRTAVVVAESAGVALAKLDPLGGLPGPEDYFDLMRWNASAILGALVGVE